MVKSGKVSELRADGVKLVPPVSLSGAQSALPARLKTAGTVIGIKVPKAARVVSGADERVFSAPKMAERAPVPPDPLFLEWLRTSETPARKALRGLVT